MADGAVKGYFVMGENPVVGSMNGAAAAPAMRKLDWLVVRDFQLIETAEFWRDAPEIERGEVRPEDIATEVFFFPAAAHTEKDGSFTNTQRLLQWHDKAIEPPGDAAANCDFMYHLGKRLKQLYAGSDDAKDRPHPGSDLGLSGPAGAIEEPDAEAVLREINGYACGRETGGRFTELKDDGVDGVRLLDLCGCYEDGVNQTARRKPRRANLGGAGVGLGVAGQPAPASTTARRPIRRAGRGRSGRSTSGGTRKSGNGPGTTSRTSSRIGRHPTGRRRARTGIDTIGGIDPFIMNADGKAWLFAPQRPARRAAADALRAAGVDRPESALRAAVQSGAHGVDAAGQSLPQGVGRSATSRTSSRPIA